MPLSAVAQYLHRKEIGDSEKFPVMIHGKGDKTKPINDVGAVLKEIQAYVYGERQFVVYVTGTVCENLLLHPLQSPRAGQRISPATFRRRLRAVLAELGLMTPKMRYNFDEHGVPTCKKWVDEIDHRWHDLRHSFAVWLLASESRQGALNPMQTVQKELRHSDIATTQRIYMQMTDSIEANISDAFTAYLKR